MNPGTYVSTIQGVRFLKCREINQVATVWEYQTDDSFGPTSARAVFQELPGELQVSFFDPDMGKHEAHLFIRRIGKNELVISHGPMALERFRVMYQ